MRHLWKQFLHTVTKSLSDGLWVFFCPNIIWIFQRTYMIGKLRSERETWLSAVKQPSRCHQCYKKRNGSISSDHLEFGKWRIYDGSFGCFLWNCTDAKPSSCVTRSQPHHWLDQNLMNLSNHTQTWLFSHHWKIVTGRFRYQLRQCGGPNGMIWKIHTSTSVFVVVEFKS